MSNNEIIKMKPAMVWKYFAALSEIPRISQHEEKIAQWLMNTLQKMGFSPEMDKSMNVFARIPATKGCEKLPIVLLQGHMDMVGAKRSGSKHDFLKDPITLIKQDDWLMAKDTTLGADNGIAVAMILAIIEDKTIKHGPLEILITSNEENGMVGITKFDINKLRCKYMINLDSESDSEISIGCPGNIDVVFSLPFTRETAPIANTTNLKLVIKGGIGGHSGLTISQKRINAIKQIFDTLTLIDQNFDIRLIDVEKTGVAKNVIPSECAVNICVQSKDVESIKAIVKKEYLNIKQEYLLEKELTLDVTKSNTTSLPMTKNTSKVSIGSIANLFNGVWTFNWHFGVPETSSSIGLIETRTNFLEGMCMVRSPFNAAQERIARRIIAGFTMVGAEAKIVTYIGGWLPVENNKLAGLYATYYKKIFKIMAKQILITGGVEPAFVLTKRPDILGISIGPNIESVHSPDERVQISSVEKVYKTLCGFLPTIK